MTVIDDKSILKCTLKKSADVIKKLGIVGIILGILSIIGYMILINSDKIISLVVYIWNGIITFFCMVISIPWYVYVVIGVPVCILGYSYLWCIKREFTVGDWKSEEADLCIFALFALTLALFALTLTFTLALFALFALFALTLALFAFIFAVEPVSKITIWYYVFRFPGAWYHHRKNRSD